LTEVRAKQNRSVLFASANMSSATVLPSTRSELDLFLKGNKLAEKFHALFQVAEDNGTASK